MKKLLSLILVAVMLVTAMPVAMAEGNTYKVGDIIQFGSYPQSEVKDEALIAELNALAPEWDEWTSYGYYSGTAFIGSAVKSDWMRYTDVTLNGNKYRGIKFTQYRPDRTYYRTSETYSAQDNNGYYINTIYWFLFESLSWRVLDPTTGLILSETIIDSQPYSNTIYYKSWVNDSVYDYTNDSFYINYASDYETSSIRKWLNTDFYDIAFSENESEEIIKTSLNNKGYYTLIGVSEYKTLDSNSTWDRIFLLSYNEVLNSSFGFNSNNGEDATRQMQGSDYAFSQGLRSYISSEGTYNGNSEWLLRSPGGSSDCCCQVSESGYVYGYGSVDFSYGIRPALRLKNIQNYNHKHICVKVVTNPTCTDQGYTTYTCECGYTYKDDYVDKNGHSFTNYVSDGKATCTADGKLIAKCDFCDAIDSIPEKGGHKFSDSYTIDVNPTCTSEGLKSRHCLYCDVVIDKTSIGKLAHTYSSTVISPTCTAKGYTTFTCECGDSYEGDYVDKLEHSYNLTTTITPNCTDKGYKVYTCSCGDSYTETIPAKGHSFNGSACTECDYDKARACSCNCHKKGISAIIWKILNFFYKLLRKNPVCSCGAVHW